MMGTSGRFLLILVVGYGVGSAAVAQDERPIYEQEPFDQITLNRANGGAVLKIEPLADREVPTDPPAGQTLRIRLRDRPGEEYDVRWRDIERLDLFERLVLAKAESLAAENKFDEAFDHYAFLWREYRGLPGLKESYEKYLVNSAFASYQKGNWEDALVQLSEVYRLQSTRAGLVKALARVNDKLVETQVAQGNYAAARQILGRTMAKGDDEALKQLQKKWAQRLESLAADRITQARAHRDARQFREAYGLTREALNIWPGVEGAREVAESILREHPMVIVGVAQPAVTMEPGRLDNWATRRAGRLRHRQIMEFVAPGSEGGRYVCPVGSLVTDEAQTQITIRLRHGPGAAAKYTGLDVSRRILAMADPGDPAYVEGWSQLMAGVTVTNVYDVSVDLTRRHLRIEALLRATLDNPTPGDARLDTSGALHAYHVASRTEDATRFLSSSDYMLATPSQPREITEQRFHDSAEAVRALEQGRIDVLDRVFPADVPRLRRDPALIVEPYAVPTIHMLVPNRNRPYVSRRDFRRALVYGMDRRDILHRELLGGESIEGCQVISGPLPPGKTVDDPLSYGYDAAIVPRPYEPRLAYTLAQLGIRGATATAKKEGTTLPAEPTLVLLHPADDVPRLACQRIAGYLSAIGITCEAHELAPGQSRPSDEDWDLLYVEAHLAEPLVDAPRLLGVDGVLGGGSSYLSQALQPLARSRSWKEARDQLLEVHRIAHEEVAVVPLWQLVDHLAYRRGIQGIGRQPASLYANIERWVLQPLMDGQAE